MKVKLVIGCRAIANRMPTCRMGVPVGTRGGDCLLSLSFSLFTSSIPYGIEYKCAHDLFDLGGHTSIRYSTRSIKSLIGASGGYAGNMYKYYISNSNGAHFYSIRHTSYMGGRRGRFE
jgi:hypothetical protein